MYSTYIFESILIAKTTIMNNHKIIEILVFFLLVGVLIVKIHVEEEFLSQSFGKEYLIYKKKTYRLIPYLF